MKLLILLQFPYSPSVCIFLRSVEVSHPILLSRRIIWSIASFIVFAFGCRILDSFFTTCYWWYYYLLHLLLPSTRSDSSRPSTVDYPKRFWIRDEYSDLLFHLIGLYQIWTRAAFHRRLGFSLCVVSLERWRSWTTAGSSFISFVLLRIPMRQVI